MRNPAASRNVFEASPGSFGRTRSDFVSSERSKSQLKIRIRATNNRKQFRSRSCWLDFVRDCFCSSFILNLDLATGGILANRNDPHGSTHVRHRFTPVEFGQWPVFCLPGKPQFRTVVIDVDHGVGLIGCPVFQCGHVPLKSSDSRDLVCSCFLGWLGRRVFLGPLLASTDEGHPK